MKEDVRPHAVLAGLGQLQESAAVRQDVREVAASLRFYILGAAVIIGRMVSFAVAALKRGLRRFITASVLPCTTHTTWRQMAMHTAMPKPLPVEKL